MRLDQYIPVAAKYDAITSNALAIRKILQQEGYESEIFTDSFKLFDQQKFRHSYEYRCEENDVLIVHFSMGSNFYEILNKYSSKKILYFQGITPPKYFENYERRYFYSMTRGLIQLNKLQKVFSHMIASSEFNSQELTNLGYKNIEKLPPIYDFRKLKSIEINQNLQELLQKQNNIIFIGRISPHKCQHDVIKAFYAYHKLFDQNAKLFLVGSYSGMEKYKRALDNLILSLELSNFVIFTGSVSEEDKFTYYSLCQLFLSMTEHEGFFVPGVEAMFTSLPILAYDKSGALPETCGDSAVYFSEKNFVKIATMMDVIINDQNIRQVIIDKQKLMLPKYMNDEFSINLKRIVKKFIL